MRRVAAVLMVLIAPNVLAYTADELAAKNVEAKGGLDKLNAIRVRHIDQAAGVDPV
jgi:uncharacterized membrane protein